MSTAPEIDAPIPDYVLDLATKDLDYLDEHGWVPWAWSVLAGAGEVTARIDEDAEDYPSHLLSLAGLGHLFALFREVLDDGDASAEPALELVGPVRPHLTEIEIGRYSERHGIWDRQDPETADGLVREATSARAEQLRGRLVEIVGEARLFTSLAITRLPELAGGDETSGWQGGPVSEAAIDAFVMDAVNGDPSSSAARAYAWLSGDLDLG